LALGEPLSGTIAIDLRVPGWDSLPRLPGGGPFITAVGDGYFSTVGTAILQGREILASDGKGTEPVVIVGESMARVLWPGEDPLTKCMHIGFEDPPCARVVAVAEDTHRQGLHDVPAMQYYVPIGQEVGMSGTHLLVRPKGSPTAFVPELRARLHELDPGARYHEISPLQEQIDPDMRPWRLGAAMFAVFGVMALLIAAIGLYSVISYGVAQRRTELGVRIALGARAPEILRMVLRQAISLTVLGIAIGAAVALAAAGRIQHMLFEQPARDPVSYGAVALVLVLIAIVATIHPALKASKTSPLDALKGE
jgi:hypothetical protein